MRKTVILLATLAATTSARAGQPTGEGDPAARSCMYIERPTGAVGGSALCKTNADWAQLKADSVVLDQFGEPIPPPDARNVADHGCDRGVNSGPARDGTRSTAFNCH